MINRVPYILIFIRLLFACLVIYLTLSSVYHSKWIVLSLMYIGIFSDIFDGIIARKLNISTPNLRVLDTSVDLLFYISLLVYIIIQNPQLLSDNFLLVTAILMLEGLMYAICLYRFRKLPSPHAILSKFWGIYIVIEFTLLILGINGVHLHIALIFGLIVHIDRVFIYSLLRQWDHDIPSSYHAFQLRIGKTITRKKIFNG